MHSDTNDALWEEMERADHGSGRGLLRRRIEHESRFDLFVAIEKPSNERALLLETEENLADVESRFPPLRGIQCVVHTDELRPGKGSLEIRLRHDQYRELFSVLVLDLVDTVLSMSSDGVAIEALLDRLHLWQGLMEKHGLEGLGAEAQKGLYGELWFLCTHLGEAIGLDVAVRAWRGPDGTDQDFQLAGRAVEVKTTSTAGPQVVTISSERQLDGSGMVALLLFHVSLRMTTGSGYTLNSLVDELRERLGTRNPVRMTFEGMLMKSGYLDLHRYRYEDTVYQIRDQNLFRVEQGFPRLVEREMPDGVGNVRYSLALAGCAAFRMETSNLKTVFESDDGQG